MIATAIIFGLSNFTGVFILLQYTYLAEHYRLWREIINSRIRQDGLRLRT